MRHGLECPGTNSWILGTYMSRPFQSEPAAYHRRRNLFVHAVHPTHGEDVEVQKDRWCFGSATPRVATSRARAKINGGGRASK